MSVAAPDELDQTIRRAMPELARGAAALGRLGISTAREALWYLPFRYDDFSELRPLGDLVPDEKQSARVTVSAIRVEPGFGRKPQRVVAQLTDDTGSAEAIWFGRRFVERRLQQGDEVIISGKVTQRGWRPQFTSPEFSPVGRESVHTARVVPVYHLTAGVTQKRLRELLARILDRALPSVVDPLSDEERRGLPALDDALRTAHFPEEAADVTVALDRLAFDELLALQLTLAQAREARAGLRAPRIAVADAARAEIIAALPFTLTDDQEAAVAEIVDEIAGRATDAPAAAGRRRQRKDRGRGAWRWQAPFAPGGRAALMAPTEILARQHHAGLAPLLERLGVRADFLSGSPARGAQAGDPRCHRRRAPRRS